MSVYQFNPRLRPDSDFEPGELRHVAIGRAGRLLDPRRTPVTIVALRSDVGMFTVRLDDFEDKGATWDVPLEDVGHYQFEADGPAASREEVERYRAAIQRFNQTCRTDCDARAAAQSQQHIQAATADAMAWLHSNSAFVQSGNALPRPETRTGSRLLIRDMQRFMQQRELHDIEHEFATQYVRNPNSGEMVKGHRIVLAELGLVPYEGKIVRDPSTFEDPWSKERRAAHVMARLGFVRALFALLDMEHVTLHRGIATHDELRMPANETFISASFDRAVAESHYHAHGEFACRAIFTQRVPVERLFMTYHETAAMNEHYREAEAVLLWQGRNPAF